MVSDYPPVKPTSMILRNSIANNNGAYVNIQEENPAQQSLITKVWGTLAKWVSQGFENPTTSSPITTTQVGSFRLSPTQDTLSRRFHELRTRQDYIAQIRRMLTDNSLMYASWKKYADGALGTGFTVIVSRTAKTGFVAQREGHAQRVVDRIIKRCKLRIKASSWARYLVAEADLFTQIKIAPVDLNQDPENQQYEIVDLCKMPAATMERLTDHAEQFIDPREAYIQRDINTWAIIARFAEWQIVHTRFDHEDGNRYGNSLFFPARILADNALKSSIALTDRRMATMPTLAHIMGKPDQRVSKLQEEQYKAGVSKIERLQRGELSAFQEIFINGGDVKPILTDTNLDKVDDITLLYDLALAPTGVSRQLLGSGVTVNRDVLDEQRSELYAVQRQLADLFAEEVFKPIFDFGLLLAGIDPDTVHYNIMFKQRYTESALERRIDRGLKSHAEGTLSTEDMMNVQADYFDITDPQAAMLRLNSETKDKQAIADQKMQQQMINMGIDPNQQSDGSQNNNFAGGKPIKPFKPISEKPNTPITVGDNRNNGNTIIPNNGAPNGSSNQNFPKNN